MKIYTKTGDDGYTGLFFGGRVRKNDVRCAANGSIDETVSALGLARAFCKNSEVLNILIDIQNSLFTVAAELATLPENYKDLKEFYKTIDAENVTKLEQTIDYVDSQIELPASFILPGGSPGSAALDLSRTILRRSEREVVTLKDEGKLGNEFLLKYINRLSDLLFMLARFEDKDLPVEVITGQRLND